MLVEKFHHVAFRCRDAKETVDFYKRVLDMDLIGAMAEDKVPSTKEPSPYMHIFLDAGGGSILAFFELPDSPPMGRDPNTPAWTQHIALQVADLDVLEEVRSRVAREQIDVLGPIDHTLFKSIYFHDPSGHRLEVATWTASPQQIERMRAAGPEMVEEWSRTRRPPRQMSWVHERELS